MKDVVKVTVNVASASFTLVVLSRRPKAMLLPRAASGRAPRRMWAREGASHWRRAPLTFRTFGSGCVSLLQTMCTFCKPHNLIEPQNQSPSRVPARGPRAHTGHRTARPRATAHRRTRGRGRDSAQRRGDGPAAARTRDARGATPSVLIHITIVFTVSLRSPNSARWVRQTTRNTWR